MIRGGNTATNNVQTVITGDDTQTHYVKVEMHDDQSQFIVYAE